MVKSTAGLQVDEKPVSACLNASGRDQDVTYFSVLSLGRGRPSPPGNLYLLEDGCNMPRCPRWAGAAHCPRDTWIGLRPGDTLAWRAPSPGTSRWEGAHCPSASLQGAGRIWLLSPGPCLDSTSLERCREHFHTVTGAAPLYRAGGAPLWSRSMSALQLPGKGR